MKRWFEKISKFYQEIPIWLACSLQGSKAKRRTGIIEKNMTSFCEICEKYSDVHVSYRIRPKYVDTIPVNIQFNNYEKCALVIQGPIMKEDNFTLETINLYQKHYPNTLIILSTWIDEEHQYIENFKCKGIEIVQSQKPDFPGHGNINMQFISTRAGLDRAKELNAKYICKIRTDQRIYHANILEYMINLVNYFPVRNEDFIKPQEKRIVCCGMEYGDMFYPYLVSDFFYFGTVNDIYALFDCELDTRHSVPLATGEKRRICAEDDRVTEIQIIRQFIKKHGGNCECTVEKSWSFIRNHLICLNKDEIGLYWPKYTTRYREHIRNGYFYADELYEHYKCYNWDFIHWLNLFSGTMQYTKKYEKYADIDAL